MVCPLFLAEYWKWSCAGAHMDEMDDVLVKTCPLLKIVNAPYDDFLSADLIKPLTICVGLRYRFG